MRLETLQLLPVEFSDVEGWERDDHAAAFAAYLGSARVISEKDDGDCAVRTAKQALRSAAAGTSRADARRFFESNFRPFRLRNQREAGLLTGYYEPEIAASKATSSAFPVPIYARPSDLVNLVAEADRGARAHEGLTHARQTADGGLEPFPTRAEIEQGALAGLGLELFHAADAVDVFMMQVQGSGLLRLPDGRGVRVTYDGKNGHPYTSIGRYLIDQGQFTPETTTLQALVSWLKSTPERARDVMRQNKSYVFFRIVGPEETTSALGVQGVPLSAGRSLAVDTAFHALGTPIWVSSPTLSHAHATGQPFARLMVAHDVGSAIRGPQRGDVYFGSGAAAGHRAGLTKHPARFTVLLPRGETDAER
ncbi:MAG: MltA domain-containing protein [Hyphomicrobiaceae bacterium]|nr:MltA domain-containing protein [Hyphomicrobiaceae bacterium]